MVFALKEMILCWEMSFKKCWLYHEVIIMRVYISVVTFLYQLGYIWEIIQTSWSVKAIYSRVQMFLIPMFWTELPTCLHTTMNRFLKQLGPFSLLISLTEQGINCANKFFVCTGMCASVQAPGSTQDCAQDNTSCVP